MLISPAEPKQIRELGTVSSVPETLGADILIATPSYGSVGIQRKEINDLIASVRDGRLAKELQQMKLLGQGLLLIEGRLQWSNDGKLLANSDWTVSQHLGLLWSVQSQNYWIGSADTLAETISFISRFHRWLNRPQHTSLLRRPNVKTVWGTADNRDWGIHLLQSFPGIGYETASAIYDFYGGVPLQWTVNEMDLQQVKGIGRGRAERLLKALSISGSSSLTDQLQKEVESSIAGDGA